MPGRWLQRSPILGFPLEGLAAWDQISSAGALLITNSFLGKSDEGLAILKNVLTESSSTS